MKTNHLFRIAARSIQPATPLGGRSHRGKLRIGSWGAPSPGLLAKLLLFLCMSVLLPGHAFAEDPPPSPSQESFVGQGVTVPDGSGGTTTAKVEKIIPDNNPDPGSSKTAFVRVNDGHTYFVTPVGQSFWNTDDPPSKFQVLSHPDANTVNIMPVGAAQAEPLSTRLSTEDYNTIFAVSSESGGTDAIPPTVDGEDNGIVIKSIGANGKNGRPGVFFVKPTAGKPGTIPDSLSYENPVQINTINKIGIEAGSIGGNGGNGGSAYASFWSGADGGTGASGGEVSLKNDVGVQVRATGEGKHGIFAYSVSGQGGNGGGGYGAPAGGEGGGSFAGGKVTVDNFGNVYSTGKHAHGIIATSRSGQGGTGGSQYGLFGSSGGGAAAGDGGEVIVTNKISGTIQTSGDFSHGVVANSIGGAGGDAGGSWNAFYSDPKAANGGGEGGPVSVINEGVIETLGDYSRGIFAQSVGGGGGSGGDAGGLVALGGMGSSGGDAKTATVLNSGSIETRGILSDGIFAQSTAGSGGSGGGSGGLVSIGGDGDKGGDGDAVTVENHGTIKTSLLLSQTVNDQGEPLFEERGGRGIVAQSIGGGGGSGGGAVSLAAGAGVSIGGSGAGGGDGKAVVVKSFAGSGIETRGNRSYGIFAQSVGGGGGDGGFTVAAGGGVVSVAVGGSGGKGGNGDTVDVTMNGELTTLGEQSYGILAQSVGGGGGTGGFAITGSYGAAGVNVNLGLGGSGGVGGEASKVTVNMGGSIDTTGLGAHGIFAQSVGGGGGDGGFAIAGSIGGGASLNIALGGDGGTGSAGGNVCVGSQQKALDGMITTRGDRSHGILAQSLGGGGGNGGASIAGALSGPGAISLGFGGTGGSGSNGETVDVYTNSVIHTWGVQSHGILAQSVGGGGGAGGMSFTGGVTAFGGLSLSMGGKGGDGNKGGEVNVLNSGTIETEVEYSYGIFAQSVGGGGGAGGSSGSVMANFSSLLPIPPEYPTGSVNIALALGGKGGSGGLAGEVDVDNTGLIMTHGQNSHGIFAQSVGGGGGDGGKATAVTANISLPKDPETGAKEPQLEVKVDFSMALGGNGGSGNDGNLVDVYNSGMIETSGVGAHGIFAQSVGGGGGSGGDARSMILSIDPSNWSDSDPLPSPGSISAGATMSIGGTGAAAGDGGEVIVTNDGTIITHAADAFGIFAQSIGGGGGFGGGGYHGLDWEDFGVPADLVPLADLLPIQDKGDVHIAVGGQGGSSGDGNNVTVDHHGLIRTSGDGSIAVLAQSVGGGGGIGGSGVTGGEGTITVGIGGDGGWAGNGGMVDIGLAGDIVTEGVAAHGVFAQSVGGGGGFGGNVDKGITGFGYNFAMVGDGANGGHGGEVHINSDGNITTFGNGSIGIYAQSVAGGGGLRGEIGEGFGFAGSAGGTGDAGLVEVIHTGDITTYGENAHGIFAQSVGGKNYGGEVHVEIDGDISVYGEGSRAVIAQSRGETDGKNIDVIYRGGTITGGSSAAVGFFEGIDNTFTNHGTVTTWSGPVGDAMTGTTGSDTIQNFGRIVGNIDLGEGLNKFFNHVDSQLCSGSLINLGPDALLHNEGTLSPGDFGNALVSVLQGNFEQLASAVFAVDLDFDSLDPNVDGGNSDRLEITGTASLGGIMEVGLVNAQFIPVGTFRKTVLNATLGLTDNGLTLVTAPSVVIHYDMVMPTGDGIAPDLDRGVLEAETDTDRWAMDDFDLPGGNTVAVDYTVDFSPGGLEPNLREVGDYFNRIQSAGGSASLTDAVTALVSAPDMRSYRSALSQTSPQFYGDLQAYAIQGSQQFGRLLVDGGGYMFKEGDYLLWFNFLSDRTDRESHDGWQATHLDTSGAAIGIQKHLNEKWIAGAGFAYEDHSADGYGGRWISEGDSQRIGFGINRRDGATQIGATLSYSWTESDVDRYGTLGSPFSAHANNWDLETFGAMLRASHEFRDEDKYLRAVFDVGYTHLKGDSMVETGAGGLNMAVEGFNEDHFWIRPAIDVGWMFDAPNNENWKYHIYGRLGVLHFLTDDNTDVVASLAGAPNGVSPMNVPVELGGTHTQVTLGVELMSLEQMTLGVEYTKSMSDHVDFDAWNLRCRFPF